MVSITSFAAAAILAFTVSAAPSPIVARGGQCSFDLQCAHSYGGGGPGQSTIDSVSCSQTVKSPSGKTLINTSTDMQNGHPAITFKASDYQGASDVDMTVNFDRASNHIGICNYAAGSQSGSGSVKDNISEGTVTVSTSDCTFSLDCNAS